MKIRQKFKNLFQNTVDKYMDEFVQNTVEEEKNSNDSISHESLFEEDLQELAKLSSKQKSDQSQLIIGDENNTIQNTDTISNNSLENIVVESNATIPQFNDPIAQKNTSPSQTNTSVDQQGNYSSVASENTSAVQGNSNFNIAGNSINFDGSQNIHGNINNFQQKEQKSYSFMPRKSKINKKEADRISKKKKQVGSFKLKISKKAQIIRQLSVLLDAGMDLRSSLAIIEDQESSNKNIWFFIHDLFTKIEAGDSFSDALASSTVQFDESEIAMVRAGEAIGKQAETLAKMANLMEKKVMVKKKITSAMFYPATVLVVSSIVVLLLTTFVVPKFEKVIADQIGEKGMPTLTKYIIGISKFVSGHLTEVFMLLAFFVFLFFIAKTITIIKKIAYGIILKIPVIGECVMQWCVVLFSRTFGDLLLCGSSVVESLKMARESIGNYYMKENLTLTIDDVQQGMSLTDSLRRRSVFPAMAEGLIKVGEESGKLGEMMNKVSDSYEEQLDETITRATSLIEPILVIFLALFVGSVVIGLFLPIVSLIQNIA